MQQSHAFFATAKLLVIIVSFLLEIYFRIFFRTLFLFCFLHPHHRLSDRENVLLISVANERNVVYTCIQEFHRRVTSFKVNVDRCNNMANKFQNSGTVLSHKNVSRLEDLNKR